MISIHALREEGDQDLGGGVHSEVISIHALREEGDASFSIELFPYQRISIHALREEGDAVSVLPQPISKRFLSTPSARRATPRPSKTQGLRSISIHALREEGDHP